MIDNDMSGDITTVLILLPALLWIIWDVYLYVTNKETISRKINKWGLNILPLTFIAGFLCGHWFW